MLTTPCDPYLISLCLTHSPGTCAHLTFPLTLGSICAVHGLNGNAFDTFAWEGREMWLRDFLPKPRELYPELTRLRIMTYGYSSLLRDKKNTTGLDEWSLGLIQSVSAARRSPSVTWTLQFLLTLFRYMLITKGESRSVLAPSYSYVILLEELSLGRYVLFLT